MQMFCGRGRITICLKQLQETLYQISLEKKKETKKLKKVFNDVGLTSLTTLNNFKGSLTDESGFFFTLRCHLKIKWGDHGQINDTAES